MAQAVSDAHFEATAQALNEVTNQATAHDVDPKLTLHRPSEDQHSHGLLKRIFPYTSLEQFENAFHLGNYVITRGTGEKQWEPMSVYVRIGMHALYYGSQQEKALHWKRTLALLKDQSEKMGREYDDPKSVEHIQPFIEGFDLQNTLQQFKQPDPKQYKNFNEFFAREIREDARPPAEPQDPTVISSVADSRTTVFPTVQQATQIWIKGFGFNLETLLGNAQVGQQFEGGSIAIARLAPQDYHRWHSPADGVVEAIVEIPGAYYTVNPQAINEPGTLDVFCENRRSVMLLRQPSGQLIAVVAVGAMLVGSIVYNPGVAVGATVRRGQCLGKFLYGGSTVITVFQKGGIAFDADLLRNSLEQATETLVQVGWRIGQTPST